MLDELTPEMMPVSGSDMAQGLTQGLALLKQAGADHANLLLITASDPTAESWTAAKNIAQSGSRLNIIAMLESSSATAATIDRLQQLAKSGGGTFYLFTSGAGNIQDILSSNNARQVIKDEKMENATLWQDAGPWFCLLLIPFALFLLREKAQHEKQS
jgi:Ca-activated chloride channel family protein